MLPAARNMLPNARVMLSDANNIHTDVKRHAAIGEAHATRHNGHADRCASASEVEVQGLVSEKLLGPMALWVHCISGWRPSRERWLLHLWLCVAPASGLSLCYCRCTRLNIMCSRDSARFFATAGQVYGPTGSSRKHAVPH